MVSGLFDPLDVRGVRFANRVAVSPMCMYSATADGMPSAWHSVHLGSRAVGGAGSVFVEATAVSPEGRITDGDLGMWNDEQAAALAPIAEFISSTGSVPGIQLAHAGRKGGRTTPWSGYEPIPSHLWGKLPAPSAVAFRDGWESPVEMTEHDIRRVRDDFAASAARAVLAGFRAIELHFAHGYLVHQFLSPLVNERADSYGGSLQNRMRLAEQVVLAVRSAVPDHLPLFVRLSVVDWAPGGLTIDDSIEISRALVAAGADVIDCSSGAAVAEEKVPASPGYQVGFAQRIRREAGVLTSAVGLITEPVQAQDILQQGSADIVFIGRAMLRDAYWTRHAATQLKTENGLQLPLPYRRAVERMDRPSQW